MDFVGKLANKATGKKTDSHAAPKKDDPLSKVSGLVTDKLTGKKTSNTTGHGSQPADKVSGFLGSAFKKASGHK